MAKPYPKYGLGLGRVLSPKPNSLVCCAFHGIALYMSMCILRILSYKVWLSLFSA